MASAAAQGIRLHHWAGFYHVYRDSLGIDPPKPLLTTGMSCAWQLHERMPNLLDMIVLVGRPTESLITLGALGTYIYN